MKLQGEYDFKDFMDLYYNKYYFNSKQNLSNRILIVLCIIILILKAVLFVAANDLFNVINAYAPTNFIIFLLILLTGFYCIKPKFIYDSYKKNKKAGNYIEVDEKEFKLYTGREIRIEMNRLRNTVVLKHGYFLDFDETFLFYVPHRFFRNTEELRTFHSLCYKRAR